MPNCDDCDLIEMLGNRVLSEVECKELEDLIESNRDYHEREKERNKSYWIDGFFHEDWNKKAYFSHDRGVYVPKFATVKLEPNRIYITEEFVYNILREDRVFDSTNRHDMLDLCLKNIINKPWVKGYNPPFEVSL